MKGGTAMIRIWSTHEPNAITITIDGQLVVDYVESVQTCVDQVTSEQKQIHLFLRDVSHIDEAGRALLVRLAAQGVVLSASGLYSSYLVAEITQER
jgi:ABC-type transporter Mla MlaB component